MENINKGTARHRAFSVFLFDSKHRLLLQQRAACKVTFPLVWTNTCCSHPLYRPEEMEEENSQGVRVAARRKLEDELGIDPDTVDVSAFTCLGRMHYKAPSDGKWGEHEIDYLLVLKADLKATPNPNEVAAVRFVDREELKELVRKADKKEDGVVLSPWFRLVVDRFLPAWWDHLDAGTLTEVDYSDGKELVVFLIDAGPDMFLPYHDDEEEVEAGASLGTQTSAASLERQRGGEEGTGGAGERTYFEEVLRALVGDLKTRIISRESDLVSIAFFNTRTKQNVQSAEGVFVFQDNQQTSAQLIRDFSNLPETFEKDIGSGNWLRGKVKPHDNPISNALWVVQGLLRTGSTSQEVLKNVLLFTNDDDPFGAISNEGVRSDMRRTTIQKAKDARALGIQIDLFPLSRPGEKFNSNIFFADMLGVDDSQRVGFQPEEHRLSDLQQRLRKKVYRRRMVKRIMFAVLPHLHIALSSYALIRPAKIQKQVYVRAVDNRTVKVETALVCQDTGAVLHGPLPRYLPIPGGTRIIMAKAEVDQVKAVSPHDLLLLGFKPLHCLKDYHNLQPPTFLFPDEETLSGSTAAFIALHNAMLDANSFALACWAKIGLPRLVAIVPQQEKVDESGTEVQPAGWHMIPLPFYDDLRPAEKVQPAGWHMIPLPFYDDLRPAEKVRAAEQVTSERECSFLVLSAADISMPPSPCPHLYAFISMPISMPISMLISMPISMPISMLISMPISMLISMPISMLISMPISMPISPLLPPPLRHQGAKGAGGEGEQEGSGGEVVSAPRADAEQVATATTLMRYMHLKDFSPLNILNPGGSAYLHARMGVKSRAALMRYTHLKGFTPLDILNPGASACSHACMHGRAEQSSPHARTHLKDFTALNILNPVIQTHYSMLEAIALDLPEVQPVVDTTLPDYNIFLPPLSDTNQPRKKGKAVRATAALRHFKDAVYGPGHDEEEAQRTATARAKADAAEKKRKATYDAATAKAGVVDWRGLAEKGKVS
ncbi:unnamed protein product [Closterium sp. NIES-65]|nr:unnamed protein product [Closterium sp. NIES-65]